VLAIGSRDLATSTLLRPESPVREALGRTYNRLLQATITPGVVDTQCGAKVASRAVWEAVLAHTTELGFAWDAEAIAVARALGIEVQEVPIDWRTTSGPRCTCSATVPPWSWPRPASGARRAGSGRTHRARCPSPSPPTSPTASPRGEVFDAGQRRAAHGVGP
jgi:hypothetical protein